MPEVAKYFRENGLKLSPGKSSTTLFSSYGKESQDDPGISIGGEKVPLNKTPKILGVTFDTMLSFGPHVDQTAAKVRRRGVILKCLAGTGWGQDKETLVTTFKAISRPVLDYASSIWTPLLSNTRVEQLQRGQNAALRTAVGCVAMTDIGHLHKETRVLPVRDHCVMRAAQLVAKGRRTFHPAHPFSILNTSYVWEQPPLLIPEQGGVNHTW